jgi:hypothetical protein
VPSSTSNSKERAPSGSWVGIWILALGLFLLLATGLEVALRVDGFVPTIRQTPAFWAFHRRRVDSARPGRRVLTLVGQSRMDLDIDLPVLTAELPHREVVQLAIPGMNPLPVLRDLAEDSAFSGDVVVSLLAGHLLGYGGDPREYVAAAHKPAPNLNGWLNLKASTTMESHLVLLDGEVSPRLLLTDLVSGSGFPQPSHIWMSFDRERKADFSRADVASLRANRIAREKFLYSRWRTTPPSDEAFSAAVLELRELVSRIQDRGGRVALVRLPTSDELWEMEEKIFPRTRFWDRIAREVGCLTIHFRDVPEMASVHLPDTSHLDYRDAPAFTRALLRTLSEAGFFQAVGSSPGVAAQAPGT